MQHIETSLAEGLAEGRSAAELSRTIREDLREPHKLFRRVRDKNGILQLSKPARAFHPGQGVYRSSYKNALRLTRTEINVSYAEADFERWQRLDFVIGYEVRLSNNHTCNGHPFTDICDELAGKYPKWFKFTKWHPQCRCVCLAIFGDDPGAGEVRDVPPNFKQWVTDNKPRLDRSIKKGTAPYWVRDNFSKEGKLTGAGRGSFADVSEKLRKAVAPITSSGHLYVSFEPFSPLITEYLHRAKDRKQKAALFKSILNDERTKTIHTTNTAKTTLYPNHKGVKQPSWGETAKAAQALNRHGINVSFLPEYEEVSSADAIIGAGKRWTLADFKATTTRNGHTLYKELEKGFEQAHTIVLKMGDGDAGTLRDAIDELTRKGCKVGDLVLITQYDKVIPIQRKHLLSGQYLKKIKGLIK